MTDVLSFMGAYWIDFVVVVCLVGLWLVWRGREHRHIQIWTGDAPGERGAEGGER